MDLLSGSSHHSRRKGAALEAIGDQKDSAGGPVNRSAPLPTRSFHFPTRLLPLPSRSFHLPRARHSSTRSEAAETPEKCGYQSLGDDTSADRPHSRQPPLPPSTLLTSAADVDEVEPDHVHEYAQLSVLGSGQSHQELVQVQLVSQASMTDSLVLESEATEMYGYENVSEYREDRNRRESRRDRSSRRRSVGHSSVSSIGEMSLHSMELESPEKYGYEDCHSVDTTMCKPRSNTHRRPTRRASIGACTLAPPRSTSGMLLHSSLHSMDKESCEEYGYEDCHRMDTTACKTRSVPRSGCPTRRASIGTCTYEPPRSTSPRPMRRQRRRSIDNRHQHQHPTCLSGRTRTTSSTLAKRRASLGSVSPDASTTGTETETSSPPSVDLDRLEKDSDSISDDDDDVSFGGMDQPFHRSLNDSMVHVLEGLEALDAQLLYGYS